MSHCRFHSFSTLKNKWELHLTATKQFTHHFHSIQQKSIDDMEGGIVIHGLVKGRLQSNPFAINNVLL